MSLCHCLSIYFTSNHKILPLKRDCILFKFQNVSNLLVVSDVKLLHFKPPHCQPGKPLASPVFQNAGAVAHFWRPTAVNTSLWNRRYLDMFSFDERQRCTPILFRDVESRGPDLISSLRELGEVCKTTVSFTYLPGLWFCFFWEGHIVNVRWWQRTK